MMMLKEDFQKVQLPKVIFGTSGLGNLYVALDDKMKCAIVEEFCAHSQKPIVFDSAGKYGAGLALESLGKCLRQLNIKNDQVSISNKLGWYRTELKTPEPTFEPGVWRDLKHDAVQKISYEGILECYEQGNELLGGYKADMVSVHDPDEYIGKATTQDEVDKLYRDILDAYIALYELKQQGKVKSVGIGAKDWRIIKKVAQDIDLDWVMIANSMTIHSHPDELVSFMEYLRDKGVTIINSAVFNGGFLTGADYYNYQLMDPQKHFSLYRWRQDFFSLCHKYGLKPTEACISFGLNAPGVSSIALSTSNIKRIKENFEMTHTHIPIKFWNEMKAQGLINENYTYLKN